MGNCEQNSDRIIDAVTGNLAESERAALDEHLATCDACRREAEATGELWNAMGAVAVPESPRPTAGPPPVPPAARPPRRPRLWPAVAASLVLGALGGYLLAPRSGGPDATPPGEGAYLVLLRQAAATLGPEAPAESVLVREYTAWAGALAERHALILADRLSDDDVELLAGAGPDPAILETAPHISGFFLLRADSFDEATAIAETMPHLRYGGAIEVRAVARD